ncbi:MAG: CocE/NonD family hydrolase [Stagnimonas sp.]|nr:CocE/NonD family hydrolase [Stagnimonas sp.]
MIRNSLVLLVALALCACGESNMNPTSGTLGPSGETLPPPKVAVTETRVGADQHVVLASRVDGVDVSFQMFEPDNLVAGQTYPLVLEGHGYGGMRTTTRDGFIGRLTAAGYYVISIDERGFGASGGTVRVMSPDQEGQDLIQILDWAEDLPGLRRRSNNEMYVGSFGGSYGGMYQLLLAGADPKQRLRVLAPDITPHDLVYALNPHNVIKSGWVLALVAAGEASGVTSLAEGVFPMGTNQDPAIVETLVQGALTNNIPTAGINYFTYHSVKYFCDGQPAAPQDFMLATPDPLLVPPRPYPALDVLVTQGTRDGLFNFNDGFNNYNCLKQRGGDVRFLTHETGHILPVSITNVPGAEEALDPFYAAITVPNFEDAAGARDCGSLVLDDVQFAWFQEKLQFKKGAIDAALPIGKSPCLSLGAGDAVSVPAVKVGGTPFPFDLATPQFSGALGILGSVLGNGAREQLLSNVPLMTVGEAGGVLAGVPTLDIELTGLTGLEMLTCPTPLSIGACDPILFLAIGHRKAGTERWDVVDDQITPVRGFGAHSLRMNGIGERLAAGDELALLIYGFHAQFPITWSRDVFVPAVNVKGSVALPLLGAGDIVKNGV